MRRIIAISLFVLVASASAYYYSLDEASATGGAFPYTKHGGGTTDGATPCAGGVNRGLGDDYGGNCASATYNSATEAGKYKSGECTHCHEPHASFGGAEPAPGTAAWSVGPARYLLLGSYTDNGGNYANVCWYCHENMFNINGEGSPTGMGRFKFYQGKTVFEASSHNNPPSVGAEFFWPGTTGDPQQIWPRQNRFSLPNQNRGSCLNCHTPHGIKATDAASAYDTTSSDGSGGVPASMQTVASGNPSVMSDYMIPRQLIAWEETLCEGCHKLSSPTGAPDVQTEINKNIRTELIPGGFQGRLGWRYRISGTGHPVDNTSLAGRHTVKEPVPIGSDTTQCPGGLQANCKHVECYDCHNPHAVKAATTYSVSQPGAGDGNGARVTGVKYVDINGFAQDPAPIGVRQPYIYEVCLKCHGDTYKQVFDTTAATDDVFPDEMNDREGDRGHFSNKRKEFDPSSHHFMNYPAGDIGYNTAYHPVAAPGRNGTYKLCMQLKAAFNLTCTNGAGAAAELSSLTIQCTDCHNTNATGATDGLLNGTVMSPVGPVTKSNLRSTDRTPKSQLVSVVLGPHGSERNRLLRGNYLTQNSPNTAYGGAGTGWYFSNRMDTATGRPKFELCFLCHDESSLVIDASGNTGAYTNFGSGPTGTSSRNWSANLHQYHLNAQAVCHDCHHNVHSNVEARNTIYGNGLGAQLPGDDHDGISDGRENTHLINFGPQAFGATSVKPRWYFDGSYFRCNLQCHGFTMSLCYYTHNKAGQTVKKTGGHGGGPWCA